MPTNLQTPIRNDQTVSVNFFNGRIVSGEDLTAEQNANRKAREFLGQAIGDGVVRGLEVSEATGSSALSAPVLMIKAGLALNRNGHELFLADDTLVSLVRPATPSVGTTLFDACTPPQSGVYIASAGVYILVISPARAATGLAQTAGLGNVASPCNTRFNADAVQFRLIQLDVPPSVFNESLLIRNRAAYLCSTVLQEIQYAVQPLFPGAPEPNLLDSLRPNSLTPCDVPLCILFWSATAGIQFVDLWAVRRTVRRPVAGVSLESILDNLDAEQSARILQFQDHVEFLRRQGTLRAARAVEHFEWLPPLGMLPLANSTWPDGIEYLTFFDGIVYKDPTYIEGARLQWVLRNVTGFPPVHLASGELVRLHRIRENQSLIDTNGPAATRPYMLFVTGEAPNFSDAHYNVSHFDYSNNW